MRVLAQLLFYYSSVYCVVCVVVVLFMVVENLASFCDNNNIKPTSLPSSLSSSWTTPSPLPTHTHTYTSSVCVWHTRTTGDMASVAGSTTEQPPAAHGHSFCKKTFHKPTYCHHCSDMLWGPIQQGFVCEGASPRHIVISLSFPFFFFFEI